MRIAFTNRAFHDTAEHISYVIEAVVLVERPPRRTKHPSAGNAATRLAGKVPDQMPACSYVRNLDRTRIRRTATPYAGLPSDPEVFCPSGNIPVLIDFKH